MKHWRRLCGSMAIVFMLTTMGTAMANSEGTTETQPVVEETMKIEDEVVNPSKTDTIEDEQDAT